VTDVAQTRVRILKQLIKIQALGESEVPSNITLRNNLYFSIYETMKTSVGRVSATGRFLRE
jgi:hypothetical protein